MIASLEAVTVQFKERQALRDVTTRVGPGVTVLLGANGAGKSTLMRLLATVEPPTAGSYTFDGADPYNARHTLAARGRIGWLPQTFGYEPSCRLVDFVTYLGWLRGLSGPGLRARVADALQTVALTDRAGSRMKTLSGGMVRRAGIAQAIVAQPDLLLLDEPGSGLDPLQRSELASLIQDLARSASVVVSTHFVDDAVDLADRIVILRQGAVVWEGTPDELIKSAGDGSATQHVVELLRPVDAL